EIPGDQTGWGSFYTLYEDNQKNLKAVIEEAIKEDNASGSAGQKVADLYASGMDTMAIEKLAYDPVKPLLEKIDGVKDYKQLVNLSADGFKEGDGFLFGIYVG